MGVLLISQVFYPDQVAVSNLFTKLFGTIAQDNSISITVWCAQPSYTTLERQPRKGHFLGMNINYLLSTNFSKDRFLGRLMNVFSFSLSVVFRLIFYRGNDVIVVHTTPPFLAILVVQIAKLKRKKVVYVLMDIFPDGLIRLGRVSGRNPFIKLWKHWHRNVLKKSTRVVAIGRDMVRWVLEENPNIKDNGQLQFIPLWQDERLINPVAFCNNLFAVKYSLTSSFVVQFSGNMGLWNDLETVGKAASARPKGVKFVFIGDGIRKRELINAIGTDKPDNALFLPFLDNSDYANSVTACHCGIVTLRPEAVGMGVPSKIIGIMAAGTPVLAVAPGESEIAKIVMENSCGIVIKPGDDAGLVNAIDYLKNNEGQRLIMGLNARKAFEKKFTTEIAAKNYYRLLKEFL